MYSSSGETDIGATLRKARQDAGVTLEDVEEDTKIRKRYLTALEREDYADLPSAVYARGFLKTYANYLGLDGEALSMDLKDRWESIRERRRQESTPKRESGRQGSPSRSSRSFTVGASSRRRRISITAMIGFVLLLALLAAAVFGLYSVGQNSRSVQENPNQQAGQNSEKGGIPNKSGGTTVEETSTNTTSASIPGQGADTMPGNDAEAGLTESRGETAPLQETISMKIAVAQVSAWLNVQADGNTVYEQVTQPGFSQTFEAGDRISVWTGNAGAVRLEINGQDYGALGAPGEVKRRTFTLKPPED